MKGKSKITVILLAACFAFGRLLPQIEAQISVFRMADNPDPRRTMGVAVLDGNTIHGNSSTGVGGGVCCDWVSTVIVTGTILWGDQAPTGKEVYVGQSAFYPSMFDIAFSDLEGGQTSVHVEAGCFLNWGTGMIDSDPFLIDPAGGDYHLPHDSPCRDAGSSSPSLTHDFEGDPRIAGAASDIGADEFHPHLYHVGSVVPGGDIRIRVIGSPATTPVTLALGSGLLGVPQSTIYGLLYIQSPYQRFPLGTMPANGVLSIPATVPGSWIPGQSYHFQALLGPMGSSSSILTNLMTLEP